MRDIRGGGGLSVVTSRELNVCMNGQRLRHDPHPVYLGVTLDRTLSYRQHLTKTADKLKSRNNLPAEETCRKHLGCECGHSSLLCSSPLLLRCGILLSSVALLSLHKSCRL